MKNLLTYWRQYAGHICLVLFVFLLSCQKTEFNEPLKPTSNDISVDEAKNWFEKNYKDYQLNNSPDFEREVDWSKAFDYKGNLKRQTVVVPIIHRRRGIPSGYKQLWVYKSQEGVTKMMVAEYINNKENMDEPYTPSYSGYLVYKDWDDNVLGGFYIEKDIVKSYISDLKFSNDKAREKNARPSSTLDCYTAPNCRVLLIQVFYQGVWGTFSTQACDDRIVCIYQDYPGITPQPIAPHWIPVNNGIAPSGFDFFPNDYKKETVNDKCAGLNRMYGIGFRGNDPILTKEVTGFLTVDNKVIIAPTAVNTSTKAVISTAYYDQQGRKIIDFDWESHRLITIDHDSGLRVEYYITGTIHTHPYVNDPTHPDNAVSDEDKDVARAMPLYKHYTRYSTGYYEYDANGKKANTDRQMFDCQ